jgi:hypothetical protein
VHPKSILWLARFHSHTRLDFSLHTIWDRYHILRWIFFRFFRKGMGCFGSSASRDFDASVTELLFKSGYTFINFYEHRYNLLDGGKRMRHGILSKSDWNFHSSLALLYV